MSSPIFDATFGTGRFKSEEPMTTDQSQSDAQPHRDPDDTKVICPNCTHQFRAISVMDQARLAQSDAEPKHDVRVTDAMVEAAGEAWLRARLNIEPDGLTEERWSEILSAMRVVLAAALAEAIAAEIRKKPEFKEMIARAEEKPDASGLIDVLAGDLGLILRGLIAKYHGPLRSRAADRNVHGDLIPDCPTDGVAARQGNGG